MNKILQQKLKKYEEQPLPESRNEEKKTCKCQNRFEMDKNEENMRRNESFILRNVPEMIKKSPNQVTYTMLSQTKELVGLFGSQRIAYLKK